MKVVTTFSKREYVVEDTEAEVLERRINIDPKGFVKLRTGHTLNLAAIESVGPAPLVRFYGNQVVLPGMKIVNDYGNIVQIESPKSIYYDVDPKYEAMLKAQTQQKQIE